MSAKNKFIQKSRQDSLGKSNHWVGRNSDDVELLMGTRDIFTPRY